MTPLVDITFLLLTFLMFTAKFKSDAENEQQFTIVRPIASPDTTKLPERDLATINIAIDDKKGDTTMYFGLTNANDQKQIWSMIPDLPPTLSDKKLVPVDSVLLTKFIRTTLAVRPATRFALDADKRVRFKFIMDAMNIMRKSRATVFNFVTEKKKN